jgi:hypothetical protein
MTPRRSLARRFARQVARVCSTTAGPGATSLRIGRATSQILCRQIISKLRCWRRRARSTSANFRFDKTADRRHCNSACFGQCPLRAKSGPSLTIIIYVRNIFGLATKESSHPSMMATGRTTTSAVPPTADIAGQHGHVRKMPQYRMCQSPIHCRRDQFFPDQRRFWSS